MYTDIQAPKEAWAEKCLASVDRQYALALLL